MSVTFYNILFSCRGSPRASAKCLIISISRFTSPPCTFDERRVKLLDDGQQPSPRERYNFGAAVSLLFRDGDDGLVRLSPPESGALGGV